MQNEDQWMLVQGRLRTVAAKEYKLIYLRFLMFPYVEGLLYDL
jgi:hypothetical protein